jgi:hypothetical protein
MPLCVYAIVPATMRWGRKWRGVQGETLRSVRCGDAAALIGTIDAVPHPDRVHLEQHDALMRAIASEAPAALPARFGLVVRDLDRLHALVDASGISFREALRLVSGREQMTLRVRLADTEGRRAAPRSSSGAGAGRRYLAARMAQARMPQDPALTSLRKRLSSLVREERVRPPDHGNSVTVYHLIERGQSAAYFQVVRAFSERHPHVRVTASGPFPPYAFAPTITNNR